MDERVLFVESIISNPESRILEIGPLNRPIATKEKYPNVYYCDIRATEEIKELYTGNDYLKSTGITIDIDTIVNVDYVVSGSYQETFMGIEKFDYIIVSHVMEHMEDIIGFLQDIYKIMSSEGKLCIIYPDKRYCFDHFRVEASFRDAYDVFARGIQEVSRMTLDFFYNVVDENDAVRYWDDQSLADLFPYVSMNLAKKNYELSLQKKKIPDVHYWHFSDRGFLKFLYDCLRAELISYSCKKFVATQVNSQQFMVMLEKCEKKENNIEIEHLKHLILALPDEFRNKKWIAMEQRICNLEDTIRNMSKEHLELNITIKTAQTKLADLNDSLMELKKGKLEVDKLLAESQKKNSVIEEQLTLKNRELNKQNDSIANLYRELVEKKEQLNTLKESTSWKMTAPLRNCIDIIKSMFIKI